MSTEYHYVCESHEPHLHDDSELTSLTDMRWLWAHRVELSKWRRLAQNSGPLDYPRLWQCDRIVPDFLVLHRDCVAAIVSEKGDRYPLTTTPAPEAHEGERGEG